MVVTRAILTTDRVFIPDYKKADTKLDERGNKIKPEDYGDNVLIVMTIR